MAKYLPDDKQQFALIGTETAFITLRSALKLAFEDASFTIKKFKKIHHILSYITAGNIIDIAFIDIDEISIASSLSLLTPNIPVIAISNAALSSIENLNLYGVQECLLKEKLLDSEQLKMTCEFSIARHQIIKDLQYNASHDALTNIYNRCYFDKTIQKILSSANRHKKSFCVCICDIDKSKNINDTYGHLAGDQALKSLAKIIKNTIREEDFIARLGGDEFVIYFSYADLAKAEICIRRIQQKLHE